MRQSLTTCVLLATAFVTALTALAPTAAIAREGGARSVGNGIKCATRAVRQADGTITYQYVCYKGV